MEGLFRRFREAVRGDSDGPVKRWNGLVASIPEKGRMVVTIDDQTMGIVSKEDFIKECAGVKPGTRVSITPVVSLGAGGGFMAGGEEVVVESGSWKRVNPAEKKI